MRRDKASGSDKPFCSWLGTCAVDNDVNAANAMVAALKSSVVAYLGTTFCFADITIPNIDNIHQKDIIQAAVAGQGLRQTLPTINAWKSAVAANIDWDMDCTTIN
jgi:hypothetical protein